MTDRDATDLGRNIIVARLRELEGSTTKAAAAEAAQLTRMLLDIEQARVAEDHQRAALLVAVIVGRRGLDKLAPADREKATRLLLGSASRSTELVENPSRGVPNPSRGKETP